jgi:hypothetical protein
MCPHAVSPCTVVLRYHPGMNAKQAGPTTGWGWKIGIVASLTLFACLAMLGEADLFFDAVCIAICGGGIAYLFGCVIVDVARHLKRYGRP